MDVSCPVCSNPEPALYLDGDDNEISLASVGSSRTLLSPAESCAAHRVDWVIVPSVRETKNWAASTALPMTADTKRRCLIVGERRKGTSRSLIAMSPERGPFWMWGAPRGHSSGLCATPAGTERVSSRLNRNSDGPARFWAMHRKFSNACCRMRSCTRSTTSSPYGMCWSTSPNRHHFSSWLRHT